jgi:hypothetical protein
VSDQTSADILVYLKLFEMATTPEMRAARTWMLTEFAATDFESFRQHYPTGSLEWRRFTDVCNIMELFGVLLKHNKVEEDLLFDLFGGVDILWEAAAAIMPGMRSAIDDRLYENFELLYRRAVAWQQARTAA